MLVQVPALGVKLLVSILPQVIWSCIATILITVQAVQVYPSHSDTAGVAVLESCLTNQVSLLPSNPLKDIHSSWLQLLR
jgi:hypothetical protein